MAGAIRICSRLLNIRRELNNKGCYLRRTTLANGIFLHALPRFAAILKSRWREVEVGCSFAACAGAWKDDVIDDVNTTDTHGAIDAVWRIESAKLIAGLTRIVRDAGIADDLAQEALVAALQRWP